EVTRPAREVLRQLNGDVTRGSRTMSAAQRLALFQRLLPGITAREVSDTFTAAFDPKNGIFIAELPATDRVPSEAEFLTLRRPATSRLTSTQIRDLMTGAKVRVRSGMGGDIVGLTVSGDPAELERGLQLAYLLLTDPVIEEPALEQWRDAELQRIVQRKTRPM